MHILILPINRRELDTSPLPWHWKRLLAGNFKQCRCSSTLDSECKQCCVSSIAYSNFSTSPASAHTIDPKQQQALPCTVLRILDLVLFPSFHNVSSMSKAMHRIA